MMKFKLELVLYEIGGSGEAIDVVEEEVIKTDLNRQQMVEAMVKITENLEKGDLEVFLTLHNAFRAIYNALFNY